MKIAYVYLGGSTVTLAGVRRKLAEQLGCWSAAGHEVRLFVQTRSEQAVSDEWTAMPVELYPREPARGWRRLVPAASAFQSAARLADAVSAWRPELVYLRFSVHYPSLTRLGRQFPLILEINSDDVAEYRSTFGPLRYWYHRVSRSRLLREAQALVFVTAELRQRSHFARFAKPAAVIPNGITLSAHSGRIAPSRTHPQLVFVGEPDLRWHGVDKILELARLQPEWSFDIVGYHSDSLGAAIPPNVTAHGYVSAPEYRALLRSADVGIGTLALHRKGMNEACPLKVREYLACGLPVLLAYRDTDFPTEPWFIHRLPNTETNVTDRLGSIRAWVAGVVGRRVHPELISHLDVRRKEEQRLAFFQRVRDRSLRERAPA